MANHHPNPRPFLLERYFARFEFTARFLVDGMKRLFAGLAASG